jgi:branched-subunit amino acid transport protein
VSRVAVWWAVLAASVVVLATKVLGHVVPERVLARPRVTRTAALVTAALLAALVAVQVGTSNGALVLDARVVALVVAAVALLLRAPFVLVVLLAAATAALLRRLGMP